jgi:hypothetical protein
MTHIYRAINTCLKIQLYSFENVALPKSDVFTISSYIFTKVKFPLLLAVIILFGKITPMKNIHIL